MEPIKKNGFKKSKNEQDLLNKIDNYLKQYKKDEVVPTIEGLALFLGCSSQALYKLFKDHPKVEEKINELKTLQVKKLISGGLSKKYNDKIVKVLLSLHGYIEKRELELAEKPYIVLDDEE